MSKFFDVNIKNNSENINITQQNNGGQNLQYTKIEQNTTHNNYNNSNNNKDNSEFFGVVIAGIFCLLFAIYFLFSNYEKIYLILKVGAISSPLLSIFGVIVLTVRNQVERNDILRFVLSLIFAIIIFLLNEYLDIQVPNEMLELSTRVKSFLKFWTGLNGHGKNIAISIMVSCLLILFSIILNYFLSIRSFAYALSNVNRTGFWYFIYNATKIFRLRISGLVIIGFSIFTILILKGYIFNMAWS